jgi:hypothetical protein
VLAREFLHPMMLTTGEEYSMKRGHVLTLFLVIIAAIFLASRHCGDGDTLPVSEATAIPVTAESLHAAFVRNEVAAENNYKGQMVTVFGTVHSILTFGDQPVVNLFGSDRRGGVQCYFDKSQRETVARIERGEQASFKCRCDGFNDDVVIATGCIVQSP